MEKTTFIGIDVSKLTLDVCIKSSQTIEHAQITNCPEVINDFFSKLPSTGCYIIAMENTGTYNYHLYESLSALNMPFYVLNPLHLKKSVGLVRSKTDKDDALMIAGYIAKHYGDLEPFDVYTAEIIRLKALLAERRQRIADRKKYTKKSKEYHFLDEANRQPLEQLRDQMVDMLNQQVKTIEQQIQELIKNNEHLCQTAKLMQSVPGVGKVLCWTLLAKTNGFRNISTARKMACFAGVVPFQRQSGSSLHHKPRVSYYADKTLKCLLHMAALSAIQRDNDLSVYYLRKVEEGKNKMSVLNAVRNKIIHIIYAVVKKQKMYQNSLVVS